MSHTSSSLDCIFCKIIAGAIPSPAVAESETVLVIKDIAPKFPTHYLIVPKKHIAHINALTADDRSIAADILFMAQELAHTLPEPRAFRLLFNTGADAGQSVFHLHAHFLAGKKLTDF